MRFQYNVNERLKCIPDGLVEREVGVMATVPMFHRGQKRDMVEIFAEFPTVNTQTVGEWADAESWTPPAIASLQMVIAKLDAIVAELAEHRQRLTQCVAELKNEGGTK